MLKYQLKEIKSHGTPSFPFQIYDVQFATANTQILPLHWHQELEIIFVSEGEANFTINQKSCHVTAGQLLFITGGSIHSGYTFANHGCHYHSIVFDLSILNTAHHYLPPSEHISPLGHTKAEIPYHIQGTTPKEKKLIEISSQLISKKPDDSLVYEYFVRGSLFLFFSILFEGVELQNATPKKTYNNRLDNIKKSLSFIENNHNKKITINDMASHVNMSRHYFCKFFKDYTSLTPFEYLNTYRINRAADLLNTKNYTVTEAAYEVGYENLSYFIKLFKKHKNVTPGQWR